MRKTGVGARSAVFGFLTMVVAGIAITFCDTVARSADQRPSHGQEGMRNPAWARDDTRGSGWMGPGMRQRMARHRTFMHRGVPAAYRGATCPPAPDAETIRRGGVLYRQNCAACHGMTGMGDGEMAEVLDPPPPSIAHTVRMPMAVDEFLLWSIADGGEAFGTAMPAFKHILEQDDICRIILYMRAGFPAGETRQ